MAVAEETVHGSWQASKHTEGKFVIGVQGFRDLRERYRQGSFWTSPLQIAGVTFHIRIWPSWNDDDGKSDNADKISVYLYPEHSISCIILSFDGYAIRMGRLSKHITSIDPVQCIANEHRGWGGDASFKDLTESGYLAGDELQLEFSISFVEGDKVSKGQWFRSEVSTALDLQLDFEDLFDDPVFSDIVFVVDSSEFKAHRSILSCRSDVFKRMFEADMEENRSGKIVIRDVDANTFKDFLAFIYHGSMPVDDNVVGNMSCIGSLLKVADRYAVDSLSDECITRMIEMLSLHTVLCALTIAHDIGSLRLKRAALDFAMQDDETLQEIMELPEFDRMSHEITLELFVRKCGKRKRDEGNEFPDETNWKKLSFAQLQRACDERALISVGSAHELVLRLEGWSSDRQSEVAP